MRVGSELGLGLYIINEMECAFSNIPYLSISRVSGVAVDGKTSFRGADSVLQYRGNTALCQTRARNLLYFTNKQTALRDRVCVCVCVRACLFLQYHATTFQRVCVCVCCFITCLMSFGS